jgi:hypothetical protein
VSCRFLAALFIVAAAACGRNATTPAVPLSVELHPPRGAQPAYVEVSGLSQSELSSLRGQRDAPDWQSLLKVTVGDTATAGLPSVQGRYAITDDGLEFTPLFPFDPGRAYLVAFDPTRLPHPRQSGMVSSVVRLTALASRPTTTVTAIYPAGEVLPENTLRLYLEFSGPMGSAGALDFVRLLDERGQEVPIPFLPLQADFWNADHTRYTLFFDPGRVKQGILPNQQLGRPLVAGRQYTLAVSADWHDASGEPLAAPYRRTFRVGPAAARPLSMATWRLAPARAGTRDPFVVSFPAPLDHGLLARALSVQAADGTSIDGDVVLGSGDTRWALRPRDPWQPGEYQLVAQSFLEDPAGNRIGRPFEVDMTKPAVDAPPEMFRTSFRIPGAGL